MFATVSVILAITEGLKKDKVAFLKKVFSNVIWITIAYIVPYVLDYFYEYTVPVRFEIGKIVIRVFLTAFAIIGGEYMLAVHSKEVDGEVYEKTKAYNKFYFDYSVSSSNPF